MNRRSHATRVACASAWVACAFASVVAVAAEPAPAVAPLVPSDANATDAYAEFRRAFDEQRYADAVPLAQRVLTAAEGAAKEPTAEDVQVALINLALTQYYAADYTAAESSFLRVIDLAQNSGRPLQARLARAYAGLAATYHSGARHDLAVKAFEQAIALARRQEGLLSERQVPLLEKYVDSLTQLGRYVDALQVQKYRLRIATRKYGERSIELTPTLEAIGRWYAAVGAYDAARRLLKHAISVAEQADGDDSPKLVGPLLALAATDRRQLLDPQAAQESADSERASAFGEQPGLPGTPALSIANVVNEGEKALLRAAKIADESKDRSAVQVADVRTQLGDWYQVRGQSDRALPQYQLAWQAAKSAPGRFEGRALVDALFAQPALLYVSRPEGWNRYSARPADQVEVRTVRVEFTVNPRGRVEDAKVTDDSGDAKRGSRTQEALQGARYRPRLEDGQPVATTGVSFAQPWILLLPEADDEKQDAGKPAAPAQAEAGEKNAAGR